MRIAWTSARRSAPAACSAKPATAPAPGTRVPGTFQLDIGQANLRREIDLHGISCMLAHFPVDAASAFTSSAYSLAITGFGVAVAVTIAYQLLTS